MFKFDKKEKRVFEGLSLYDFIVGKKPLKNRGVTHRFIASRNLFFSDSHKKIEAIRASNVAPQIPRIPRPTWAACKTPPILNPPRTIPATEDRAIKITSTFLCLRSPPVKVKMPVAALRPIVAPPKALPPGKHLLLPCNQ